VRLVVVVEQRGDRLVHDQRHIAATAAVAAVRSAERLELLPVYGGAAVAPVTRGDVQFDAVHEGGHGRCSSRYVRGFHLRNAPRADLLPQTEK
jgi:hypothetical protein